MFKKFISILIMLTILTGTVFAALPITAEAQVSLDLSKLTFFKCGFSSTTPSSPIEGGSLNMSAIGNLSPEEVTVNLVQKEGTIVSDKDYYIWVFRLGFADATVNLKGTALTNDNINYIAYDVNIQDEALPLKVLAEAGAYTKALTYNPTALVDYWYKSFSITVPALKATLDTGTYKGTLTLEVISN